MHSAGPDDLDVVVALAERAARRLAHDGKGFFLNIVEARPVGDALPELGGLGAELVVAEYLDLRFQSIDALSQRFEFLQRLTLTSTEDFAED